MSDGPWIKFYPSDWLTGTRGLSAAETGIYVTLIAMMYEKGSPLTADVSQLARLCNCPVMPFRKILDRLVGDAKIERAEDGTLFNKRAKSELATRQNTSIAASQSASKRWQKEQQKQTSDDADAMREASIAGAGQISDIRNQKSEALEPLLFNQIDSSNRVDDSAGALSSKATPAPKGTRLPNDWVLPKAWGDWALSEYPHLTVESVRALADNFRDYWIGIPGAKGRKVDWLATWRNRVRDQAPRAQRPGGRVTKAAALGEQLRQELNEKYGTGSGREAGSDLRPAQRLLAISGKARP